MKSNSRYIDRERYFQELYASSKKYLLPYINKYHSLTPACKILEVGCGEGGNLLPFAEEGCDVAGCDISPNKIQNAISFFKAKNRSGAFICCNILDYSTEQTFDVIIVHDVIEHIEPEDKLQFFKKLGSLLNKNGIVFWGFPNWYMPFGGHQQILSGSICSKIPWIHLFSYSVYESILLKIFKISTEKVNELLSIKRSKMTIRRFEKICAESEQKILDSKFWLINPYYESKFGLRPVKLGFLITKIPFLCDILATSCHYITSNNLIKN